MTGPNMAARLAAVESEPVANELWPQPLPFTAIGQRLPFPVHALPPLLAAAVEEVRAYTGAPVAMVAAAALTALSMAGQGLADVERDAALVGPVGLYLLTVAESGERKSTCDGHFMRPVQEWERDERERLKPDRERADNAREAWAAERAGKLEAIKAATKAGKPTADLKRDLDALGPEPARLPVPHLKHVDGGAEALAFALATEWPTGGLVSSEAGAVLGSHGMSKETAARYLPLLNTLWDGGEHTARRRASESYVVRGARFTAGLMVQPATLREFVQRTGELARGSGFFARFLLCEPESTQGLRLYREPPAAWPARDAVNARLRALLDRPLNWDGGGLAPARLPFTPEGKAVWVEAYNAVEGELREGGECSDVRDVASKTLDNAARLAGLFHLLEHGPVGAIGADSAARGNMLAVWYLGEARRMLTGAAPPPVVRDAQRLEAWLIEWRAKGERMGRKQAQESGPLRDGNRLNAALAKLAELGRARMAVRGKERLIELNPALTELDR